jgi:hypothetical protein
LVKIIIRLNYLGDDILSKQDKINMDSIAKSKLQSMKDNSHASSVSVTGYLESGNPAETQEKKRVKSSRNR